MRLSELGRERQIAVCYDGEEIGLTFRPAVINANWLERMATIGGEAQPYVELLGEALVRWEITDDEGAPLEPTPALLRQLPVDLLNLMAQGMIEGLAPKK